MLSDIFSFSFTLLLPNWLLISIRIYSGIARFPCDSMAFLLVLHLITRTAQRFPNWVIPNVSIFRRDILYRTSSRCTFLA